MHGKQQVRKFIYEEVTRTHTFIDKKGKEVLFKDFCTRGIDNIKEEFLEFGQDLEKLPCWVKINELRLLANVIKHGDGWSATRGEWRQALELFLYRGEITDCTYLKKRKIKYTLWKVRCRQTFAR